MRKLLALPFALLAAVCWLIADLLYPGARAGRSWVIIPNEPDPCEADTQPFWYYTMDDTQPLPGADKG